MALRRVPAVARVLGAMLPLLGNGYLTLLFQHLAEYLSDCRRGPFVVHKVRSEYSNTANLHG